MAPRFDMNLHRTLASEEIDELEKNGLIRRKVELSTVVEIETSSLKVGIANVRKSPGDITDLASSIKQVGILEPLLVRPRNNHYDVIAGTRRLAAAKQLGLMSVPCIVRAMDDETALIVSVSENVQRGDLGEEEIVEAYLILQKLNPKKWTQKEFATRLGKSQTWVSQSVTAYEALQKLRDRGLDVSMKSYPGKEEREKGAISVGHLRDVETAIRSPEIVEVYPEESKRDEKRVEMITAVKDLPLEDAKKVVDRFKMYPERDISSIKEQVESRKAGVQIGKTYLPPRVARQLDELAESRHATMEEVLPDLVEKGLDMTQSTLVEVEEKEESLPTSQMKPEAPLSVQFHEQRMWNLERLAEYRSRKGNEPISFDVITVGFSQKTVDNMIEALKLAGVKLLVDVRKNPYSQHKPEFNRNALSAALKKNEIGYQHMEMLGIPRSLRNRAYSGEITKDELFEQYAKNILTNDLLKTLDDLIRTRGTIALLCTEVSPYQCHRSMIAKALIKLGRRCFDI